MDSLFISVVLPNYVIVVLFITMQFLVVGISFWYKRNRHKHLLQQISELQQTIHVQKQQATDEIMRLQYIVENYKKQKTQEDSPKNKSEANPHPEKAESEDQIIDLVRQKRELELEKQNFLSKNKKLWEQSIAIHKEKERVDLLKKDIEFRHNELTNSIRYAQRIQHALLPKNKEIDQLFAEYFIFWKPRDIVSGDFYWIKRVANRTIVVVADCTGHGVPGAFMSMLGIAFFNEIISHASHINSSQILEQLRILVKTSLAQKYNADTANDGMDLSLCVIDQNRQVVEYSGANNPLVFIRNGELTTFKATRCPIAIYPKERDFEITEIPYEKGDRFFLFSDGYLDQFSREDNERIGSRRFREILLKHNNQDLAAYYTQLEQELSFWQGDTKQIDDILVLGFSPLV